MLPALARMPQIRRLVEQEMYFAIHAPRQTGKTTAVQALVDEINAKGERYALYCTLETLQNATDPAADYPNIRHVKFRHEKALFPQDGEPCCGAWRVDDAGTLAGITAMGYYFARELNAKTGIPMGILDDNWSGCPIEPFVNDARDFKEFLNPDSCKDATALCEPALRDARPEDGAVQFERLGYFRPDPVDSAPGAPVFNRIVTLRDSWTKISANA